MMALHDFTVSVLNSRFYKNLEQEIELFVYLDYGVCVDETPEQLTAITRDLSSQDNQLMIFYINKTMTK